MVTDDRVALFFMDYVRRVRLKMLGRMRAVSLDDAPDLAAALVDEAYGAKVERGFIIDVEAHDWNCPQHITPRYTQGDIAKIVAPLQQRIVELEAALNGADQAR